MTDVEAHDSKLRAFRKLRQVVAAAAMEGFEPIYPEEGVSRESRLARSISQGQTVARWLADRFPDMGIAAAVSRYAALEAAARDGEYGSDESPGRAAVVVVQDVLQHFIMTAPASTTEGAKARVKFWTEHLIECGPCVSDAVPRMVAARIAADFDTLTGGNRGEQGHTFATWRYRNPYAEGCANG